MQLTFQSLGNFDEEKKLSVALVTILLLPTVKFSIVQSIPGFYLYNAQANIVIGIILSILLMTTIGTLVRRNGLKLALIFSFLTVFILASYLLYPDNRLNISSHLFDIYAVSFVCFSLSTSIRDYKLLLDYLHKSSLLMVISGLAMVIATSVIGVVGTAPTEYNMSLSYYMVIPTVTLLLMYYLKGNIINLIFFGLGLLVIFAMGSRGPLLCIATFYILYNIKYKKYKYNRFLLDISYLLAIVLIIQNRDRIFRWLYETLLQFNINSRTLFFLINGEITTLSHRDIIFSELSEKLFDNPIVGIGFLGDLRSHNIILETLLFFGLFFGGLLLIILINLTIKSVLYESNKELSYLILIFLSYAIPDALLNLTVWGKDMFWIFIGFSLVSLKKSKKVII